MRVVIQWEEGSERVKLWVSLPSEHKVKYREMKVGTYVGSFILIVWINGYKIQDVHVTCVLTYCDSDHVPKAE
jgi:hypothetical protein